MASKKRSSHADGSFFDRRQSLCDTPPRIADRLIDRLAFGIFQAVFHIPNLLGDRRYFGHTYILVYSGRLRQACIFKMGKRVPAQTYLESAATKHLTLS
jgi:hypothetical protein